MSWDMGLKARRGRTDLRPQMTLSLDLLEDQRVWARVRERAREWDVTIKSVVLDALAEYLDHHPEKP